MKVVFASDGSPNAKEAARVLSRLSFCDGLQLSVLTVSVAPFNTSPENLQPWRPEWEEQQEKFAAEHHAELKEMFRQQCPDVATFHRHGAAAHEILSLADQIDADLIVVGALGHSMIQRVLLGSVSDHVATHAKCSVLIVRPHQGEAAENPPINKIMVAYDGSRSAREALTELAVVNWNQAVAASVVSVAQQFDYLMGEGFSPAAVDNEQELFEAMRVNCDYATKRVAEFIPNTNSIVKKGRHVGDTIVQIAEDNDSELIVLGDSRHSLIHDWVLGSTTKFVLRHAHCSVWISRHHHDVPET